MAQSKELAEIRENIEGLFGEEVRLKSNKGRKKISVRTGIMGDTYPNIFLVKIKDKNDNERTMSFAYTDVLIGNVQIMPLDKDSTQAC
ncbi:MAG: Veg family protein [Peptostreptococcales bacterium]